MEVTFSKELSTEEQAKLTAEVKVNGVSSLFKVDSFSGKTAKLVRSSGLALETGKYEVTVKGEKIAEKTVETTVNAVAPKTVSIINEQLLDYNDNAKVGVELKDQYGENIKFNGTDFTATAFNVTQGKPVTLAYNSTNGFFIDTKTNEDAFKVGDEIKISLFHNASGLNTNKTVKVVAGAQLASVEFGSVTLPTGKDKLTEDLTDIKVPYTAKDQYGDVVELGNNVEVVSTDENVVSKSDVTFTTTGEDKKPVINIETFKKAGSVTIALLNKATGEVYRLPLTVNEKAGVISKVAVDANKVKIAAGTGNTALVNFSVTDNYGTAIESKNYVPKAGEFTFTSSNSSVVDEVALVTDSGDDYDKLKVRLDEDAKKGDVANITVTVNKTGATATFQVEVGEKALPSAIKVAAKDEHSSNLIAGAKTTVKFDLFDQYLNSAVNTDEYQVKYEVTGSEKEAISLSETEESAGTLTDTNVVVTGEKAGSATLVAKLVKGSDVVSKVEVPFTVAANSSANFTYEVANIPTLYKGGDEDGNLEAEETTNQYVKEVKVTGKTADGKTLTVPAKDILSVTSESDNVAIGQDGKWFIAGTSTVEEDTKAIVKVVINTAEGTKTLNKEVTVSAAATKTEKVEFKDATAGTSAAKDITAVAGSFTGNVASAPAYVWVTDQFGGTSALPDRTELKITSTDAKNTSDDVVTYAGGTITITDVVGDTTFDSGAKYRVSALKDGESDDLTVTFNTAKAIGNVAADKVTSVTVNGEDGAVTGSYANGVYTITHPFAKLTEEKGGAPEVAKWVGVGITLPTGATAAQSLIVDGKEYTSGLDLEDGKLTYFFKASASGNTSNIIVNWKNAQGNKVKTEKLQVKYVNAPAAE